MFSVTRVKWEAVLSCFSYNALINIRSSQYTTQATVSITIQLIHLLLCVCLRML